MKAKSIIIVLLIMFACRPAFCQQPPEAFYTGLDSMKSNQQAAKKYFLPAIRQDSLFHGSCHFLGVIYFNRHEPDSAIFYFKKALSLNVLNTNHTRELDVVRLTGAYTYQQRFQDAFDLAWAAWKPYPDNKAIESAIRELCLWSFYIHHDHLNPEYISTDARNDYVVTSITQEYLILRHLLVNGESLLMNSQALVEKKGAGYDVFKCTLAESKKQVEVDFKINWDMNKYMRGKTVPTRPIIDDAKLPVYERAGAMLANEIQTDLRAAITKMLQ